MNNIKTCLSLVTLAAVSLCASASPSYLNIYTEPEQNDIVVAVKTIADNGKLEDIIPKRDLVKNRWQITLPRTNHVSLTHYRVSRPDATEITEIQLNIPVGLIQDDPAVVLARLNITKETISDHFVNKRIWGVINPVKSTNYQTLFEWLQLSNFALKILREDKGSTGSGTEARVAFSFLRVINALNKDSWLELGELQKSADQAVRALTNIKNDNAKVFDVLGMQRDGVEELLNQYLAQSAIRVEALYELVRPKAATVDNNFCDATKVEQFSWLLKYVSDATDAASAKPIRKVRHEWSIARDLALCARLYAVCRTDVDSEAGINVMRKAIDQIQSIINVPSPENSTGLGDYNPINSIINLNEKIRGLESQSANCD